jgi:Ser/Thr protein kinase RdoA (MazF antagonist)
MPNGLPGLDALAQVSRTFGVNIDDAVLLHHRSNAVYLLPRENVVARLAPDTPLRRERAVTVVSVTRWLDTQPGSVALPPITGEQPVIAGGAVATFWPYQPTTPPPTLGDLAGLLRRLHALPSPPFPLPPYRPLHRLREALDIDTARPHPVLSADDRAWLAARTDQIVETFAATDFPLGIGLVHADAHRENLVRHGDGWVLIDWDQTCLGPRELDLLAGLPDHFHEPEIDRSAFLAGYGYNVAQWPSWALLRDIAELHSLASYIRLGPGKPAAAAELDRRVRSLRSGDRSVRWQAIS